MASRVERRDRDSVRDHTSDFEVQAGSRGEQERETDAHRITQRQKQIDYGKNTLGYQRYVKEVPRHKRRRGTHPSTPDPAQACSKRSFDGQVRKWRRLLHEWDPPAEEGEEAVQVGAQLKPQEGAGSGIKAAPALGNKRSYERMQCEKGGSENCAPSGKTVRVIGSGACDAASGGAAGGSVGAGGEAEVSPDSWQEVSQNDTFALDGKTIFDEWSDDEVAV